MPPLPPSCPERSSTAAAASTLTSAPPSSTDAKLAALKSYRWTMGLCFKCGQKWSKDHRCSQDVLLVVEAIWDSFLASDCSELHPSESTDEQLFLAISMAAIHGSHSTRTVQFQGSLMGQPALILIDSGSSASFISEQEAVCCRAQCPISATFQYCANSRRRYAVEHPSSPSAVVCRAVFFLHRLQIVATHLIRSYHRYGLARDP